MMIRNILLSGLAALAAGAAIPACAATVLDVDVIGPGGHSNGDYGNVNAVHAAARAVLEITRAAPDVMISNERGGVSVNAIAADAHLRVTLPAGLAPDALKAKVETVKRAVERGCTAENDFRGVKPGDVVKGLRKDIRCSVTEKTL